MTRPRDTYLVCRQDPNASEGVTYFRGEYSLVRTGGQRVLRPATTTFRASAAEFGEDVARLLAGILNDFGPATGYGRAAIWRALPATINTPAERSA